jgi:hypothetical protein
VDLIICGIYLWWKLKEKLCRNMYRTAQALKNGTWNVVETISADELHLASQGFLCSCEVRLLVAWNHMELLLQHLVSYPLILPFYFL